MRTFTIGAGPDRKFVIIEAHDNCISITEGKTGTVPRRKDRPIASESDAHTLVEKMAEQLVARGYCEQGATRPTTPSHASASAPVAAKPKVSPPLNEAEPPRLDYLFDDEELAAPAAALPRLPGAVATSEPAAKKKKKRKRKSIDATSGNGLDTRVVGGMALLGLLLVGGVVFFVYDSFLKPASIVGNWKGSRTVHEISVSLTHSTYGLSLDDSNHATITYDEKFSMSGTYSLKGDRLKLRVKDEDGEESELEYKIKLDHATLDLFDLETGDKVVQLIRQEGQPSSGSSPKPSDAPADAAPPGAPADKSADAKLASVAFSPKDGAFKINHPAGWEVETGSRPDNTYSWARFTKGSAKVQVYADVAGSLMSGSDAAFGQEQESGSPSAPVHRAHETYRDAGEGLNDYRESEPAVFYGSGLGEGRIASWTASDGGLFGGKLRGYRVTLLTNNRRLTIICQAPEKEFEKLKPTLMAICRSAGR